MYASHRQLLRRAEELRHRRNIISEQYSSTKVLTRWSHWHWSSLILLVKTYLVSCSQMQKGRNW